MSSVLKGQSFPFTADRMDCWQQGSSSGTRSHKMGAAEASMLAAAVYLMSRKRSFILCKPGSAWLACQHLLLLLTLCLGNTANAQTPCTAPDCAQADRTATVITALAPLYQLTLPLLQGTSISLQLLPTDGPRSMQAQTTLFTRQAERFAENFRTADAVLGIGRIWPGDPLYTSARQLNIRVVPLDASKPWSHELDGVAVAAAPSTGQPSPYFWLSPANVIRLLDIVGTDLRRLYPQDAALIRSNLEREKAQWLQLKSANERRLLEVDDPVVYALADEFIYLTSDLGLFVDGWFVKQDLDWTEADLAALTTRLQTADIKVVLHKWEPSEAIKAAISAGGAELVVLDTLETTTDFRGGFERNMDLLLEALNPR
jgi:hypothetical protein